MKNSCKLQIEVHFLNSVKGSYKNPTETVPWNQEQDKNARFITSIQHYIEGPSQYHIINAIM